MASPSPERLEREIAALEARDLPPEAHRRAVLDRVLAAIPATAACLASADPASLALVAHTSQGVVRRGAGALYASEYGTPDVASHRSLATGERSQILSTATGGELARSHRYRTLLEPMGWRHELRAAATDRGSTWGFLHLYRDADGRDFGPDDAALAARLGPTIARSLRSVLLRGVPSAVPAARAPAVWVLDERGRIVQATPLSERTLAGLRDDETPADETPEVLVGLAAMARAAADGAGPGPPDVPRLQVPTAGGDWLTLHASVLVPRDGVVRQVAVTALAAGASDLLDLALLAHRLTPAERRTVALVLAGRSTKQIADELVLSPHTVQDRMQDVFEKVGVRSRRELVATLGS